MKWSSCSRPHPTPPQHQPQAPWELPLNQVPSTVAVSLSELPGLGRSPSPENRGQKAPVLAVCGGGHPDTLGAQSVVPAVRGAPSSE